MLAAYVGQLLEMVLVRQVGTEALHGLIIPILGTKAALPVMPCQLIQLADKSQKMPLF